MNRNLSKFKFEQLYVKTFYTYSYFDFFTNISKDRQKEVPVLPHHTPTWPNTALRTSYRGTIQYLTQVVGTNEYSCNDE